MPPIPTLKQYCKYNPSSLTSTLISKDKYDMMVNKSNDYAFDGTNAHFGYEEIYDGYGTINRTWEYIQNTNVTYVYIDDNFVSFSVSYYVMGGEERKDENGDKMNWDPNKIDLVSNSCLFIPVKDEQSNNDNVKKWYSYVASYTDTSKAPINSVLSNQLELFKNDINNTENWSHQGIEEYMIQSFFQSDLYETNKWMIHMAEFNTGKTVFEDGSWNEEIEYWFPN